MTIYYENGRDEIEERFDFVSLIERKLSGKSLLVPQNYILNELIQGKKILKSDFAKTERALRHFNEVGIASELCEWLEEHEHLSWVSFGKESDEVASLSDWEV